MEAANASVRQADLNIEYCTITSPITGIAGTRQVAPGNLVGQGEATLLTTVSNVNPMRVYVSISETEYLKVSGAESQGQVAWPRSRTGFDSCRRLHISREGSYDHRGPRRGLEDRHLESDCRVPQSQSSAAARPVRPCPHGGDGGGKRPAGSAEGCYRDAEHKGGLHRRRRTTRWRSAA